MSAQIQFTDANGSATLANGKPSPADRFRNWVPKSMPVGDTAVRQSDLRTFMFRTADQYGATFQLQYLSAKTSLGTAPVDTAARLIYHLLNGGTCSVATNDLLSNTYATCAIEPGTTPTLELTDVANLEYTLTLALINVAASPVPMLCHYAGGT